MFTNWFQQAKELVSSPTIQMGQPVPPSNAEPSASAKKKKVEEEGEMTEEGFVCVGRSSFYSTSTTQPTYSSPYNSNQNLPYPQQQSYPSQQFQAAAQHQMYPDLQMPTPYMNHQKNSDSSSLDQVNELIRQIPFVLHPDLRPHTSLYDPCTFNHSPSRITTIDWSLFDYDFDFEKGVIREVNLYYHNNM